MDIANVTQSISTIGFPIVMCLIMYKYSYEQIGKMSEAISNNTIVMNKILEKLEDK